MRTTIERFPCPPNEDNGECLITVPKNNKFLDVQFALVQSNLIGIGGERTAEMMPCFWFEVDKDDTDMVVRRFIALGTEQKYDELEKLQYIKTVQYHVPERGGVRTFVFHFYEKTELN